MLTRTLALTLSPFAILGPFGEAVGLLTIKAWFVIAVPWLMFCVTAHIDYGQVKLGKGQQSGFFWVGTALLVTAIVAFVRGFFISQGECKLIDASGVCSLVTFLQVFMLAYVFWFIGGPVMIMSLAQLKKWT